MKYKNTILLLLTALFSCTTFSSCGIIGNEGGSCPVISFSVESIYNSQKTNGYNGSYEDWVKDIATGRITVENVCVATFMVGDEVYQYQAVIKGQNLIKPKDPTIDKKIFKGWYSDDKEWYFNGYSISYNIVLNAKLVNLERIITLDAGDGILETKTVSLELEKSYKLPVPQAPNKKQFDGWYFGNVQMTDENGISLAVLDIESDATFTAHYGPLQLKKWTWNDASADGELNYGLLIGQIDHNDSAARTAGIRDHLKTRGTKTTNANTETTVEGKLTLGGKEFKVNEIEHAEQKNTSGATWDQQTATSTAENWLYKHTDKIDFLVSNNDGMAEGAIKAPNWREGLPIFGYDSNASTLQFIKEGKIMGTVNQNAQAQAAGIFMLTRNALDFTDHADIISNGFTKESSHGYGKIGSKFTYRESDHSFLVDNFAITAENVDTYLGKKTEELVDNGVKKGTTAEKKVFMSYYNNNDSFLNSKMKPLFNAYLPKFNFDLTMISGDGNAEERVTDLIQASYSHDAYIINMVKTTATPKYLDLVATKVGATEAAPTDVPVIFYNRQGTKADGTVDQEIMKDKRFKHIYYVGFDAIQGGQLQGQMIVDYFANLAK